MAHSEETKKKISIARMGKGTGTRSPEWRKAISLSLKGRTFSDTHKKALSESHKGNPGYWAGKKRSMEDKKKFSDSHKGKVIPIEQRIKLANALRGEKCYNWKGGVTNENETIRKSVEYKIWRTAVFERDDFTCQDCGVRGGTLNAGHIQPFAYYPDLRFDLSNGQTLCVPCHKKTPTYGFKATICGQS